MYILLIKNVQFVKMFNTLLNVCDNHEVLQDIMVVTWNNIGMTIACTVIRWSRKVSSAID